VRDKKPVLAVLAVVALVVGFVWVANLVTAPKAATTDASSTASSTPIETSTGTSSPASSTSGTTTSAPTPTATPSVLPGCTQVPALQTTTKKMTSAPDIEAARGKTFVATVKTNCGNITIELHGDKAPAAVASFVLLAAQKYWEPSPCHRLTGDAEGLWVLQCGDPTGTGAGPGPGYHFGVENAPADGKYPRGTVAMARTNDPNSNGDEFFLVYKDTTLPTSGGGYTIFGTITSGMEIIDKIAAAGTSTADQTSPMGKISILSVSVKPKA
jgi:peptidyl-prolyl cis-trans isomerase B (cyclophilin B)